LVKDAQKDYKLGREEAVRRLLVCVGEVEEDYEPHVLTNVYRNLLTRVGRDGARGFEPEGVDLSGVIMELHFLLNMGLMVQVGILEKLGVKDSHRLAGK
jgi:hypothetical protein